VTRALLIFNPEATTVTPRMRDVIAHALDDVVALDVAETKGPQHATELARDAAADGVDIVFCLGGDGTLNEALNGVAGTRVSIAMLPAGGTNVFARTIGIPVDPIDATAEYIDRLRDGSTPRRISLGVVNGRRFAFCAGVGFDAEVVRAVHARFRAKQRWGEPFFVVTAVRSFFTQTDRRSPALTVTTGDAVHERVFVAVVGKSDPYTFLGKRPFRLTPQATASGGLDLTLLHSMRTDKVLRLVAGAFRGGRHVDMRSVTSLHDVDGFEIEASRPVALQADGEYLGEGSTFRFGVEPDALAVL
jgi:diacylglycerol kinase family enzyme